MKRLLIALALISTSQAMQQSLDHPLISLVASLVNQEQATAAESLTALQGLLKINPQLRESLNNPHVRQALIIPIVKKIFQEANVLASRVNMGDELPQKIAQAIDSLQVPSLSKWLKDDFNYFTLKHIQNRDYYVFVTQKDPTIADLVHAANTQIQIPASKTAVIFQWKPFMVFNQVPGKDSDAQLSTTPLKSLGITSTNKELGITFREFTTK